MASALKAEAGALAERTGIVDSFSSTGAERRLPSETELTLLRVCQEALRNIERHAHASRAKLTLDIGAGSYSLRVADDGLGVASLPGPAELLSSGRLGIVGMQERARLIGATCSIGEGRDWPTEVAVTGTI